MQEQSIFIEAMEKDMAERSAFLEQACAGDPDMRQRIEKLLELHELPGGLLEAPQALRSATEDDAAGDRIGTMIGPYKLVQQIGAGGMGTVYMAQQIDPVRRLVALKV